MKNSPENRVSDHVDAQLAETYERDGFVHIKDLLPEGFITGYADEITRKVKELNTINLPMEERNTYQKAFIQVTNLWRHSDKVREFVFNSALARAATALMGTRGVRMYHDQALYKEPSGGFTPWHADQFYWPLASDKCVTAWIPLQHTPMKMGPLAFSKGSHRFTFGRDLPISDESEQQIQDALQAEGFPTIEKPYALGDVSFHAGWTFHRAGPNTTSRPRKVMTIIYMDIDMKLKQPENANQQADLDAWCPGAIPGEIINTFLNPVLFEK
ncbi:MAG: phytanoyl-CoA dioxygenase [Balneolaceae bacterium]|nr:MAG: phytanoyl-CoA dioxygenase [Balneolaceae bacterium]